MGESNAELVELLRQHLEDPDSGWSIGTFGAIAEFHRDRGEPAHVDARGLCLTTARGALRILPHPHTTVVAYEALSGYRERWLQGVAFCLAADHARLSVRDRLMALGPDANAVRGSDREGSLFDLGLAAPHVDACVRTRDPRLAAILSACAGRPVLDPDNPAFAAIRAHSPHRVFLSRLGRVEVFQPIPASDAHGATPPGPHTHLLPELLASGRTHGPDTPLPRGLYPCLQLYPPSPLAAGTPGRERLFDRERFTRFQTVLERWGDPVYVAEKARVQTAVRAGLTPDAYEPSPDRQGKLALRVALRQLLHLDGPSEQLERWRERFEPPDDRAGPGERNRVGH